MSSPTDLPINAEQRRALVTAFERARILHREGRCEDAHQLLQQCVQQEPANLLTLEALLQNLEAIFEHRSPHWLRRWSSPACRSLKRAWRESRWLDVLRHGPEALRDAGFQGELLRRLAEAAQQAHCPDVELRFWHAALAHAPDDLATLRAAALGFAGQGAFRAARACWSEVAAAEPEDSALHALRVLGEFGAADQEEEARAFLEHWSPEDGVDALRAQAEAFADRSLFDAAEMVLARATESSAGDWSLREAAEQLEVRRKQRQCELAEQLAHLLPDERAAELSAALADDLNRLELSLFDQRSQRFPDQVALRVALAQRLRRAGLHFEAAEQFSQAAIQAEDQSETRCEARLAQGECLQQVRQFEQALACYLQAVEAAAALPDPMAHRAWERLETLSEAMGRREVLDAAEKRLNRPQT